MLVVPFFRRNFVGMCALVSLRLVFTSVLVCCGGVLGVGWFFVFGGGFFFVLGVLFFGWFGGFWGFWVWVWCFVFCCVFFVVFGCFFFG